MLTTTKKEVQILEVHKIISNEKFKFIKQQTFRKMAQTENFYFFCILKNEKASV